MDRRVSRRSSVVAATILVVLAGPPSARGAGTIFLERCAAGCTYVQGAFDDSRTNRSSIIDGTRNLPPFAHGDAAWEELVTCVRRAFAPFDVAVTDVDPGAAGHWEVAVAGTPQNLGFPAGVAGVAPFACAVIPNGVAFAFAAVHGDMPNLCWTTAQELAHLFGLDHELAERDPMTYFPGCLEKLFAPAVAECGESVPRACFCGGTTQNSHAMLVAALGRSGPGSLLFGDGFSVGGVVNPDEASACRWDGEVSGVAGEGLGPELGTFRCGTEGLMGAGAPAAPGR